MDPATIAASVITLLTPYVADAGKELVKTAGEVGVGKVKTLLSWLKQQFADDPAATKDLTRFEKSPEAFTPALQASIEEKVRDNPAFAAGIEQHVKDAAPIISIIQTFTSGKNILGADVDAVRTGNVSLTQKGDTVDGMTGLRSKTIG
jgi:hypothetical protein